MVINIDASKPVKVYRNLQKKCYSIQQGGRVVGYASSILLRDCQFVVQPAGNRRVRETGRKNVHAFVKGFLVEDSGISLDKVAVYSPYRYTEFVDVSSHQPVHRAEYVRLSRVGLEYAPST